MIAYFDNSATTKPCPEAVDAVRALLENEWGNPSSVHRLGIQARQALTRARGQVAQAMGAEENRVFFTSGGTEADNWAIFSAAERLSKRGKHIITTAVEHHAVLHPMQKLAQQGFDVTFLPPDEAGRVSLAQLQAALRPDTILVSIMLVNNETGAVMPIEKMAKLTHRQCPAALFHTDAVQGLFKVPFQAKTLGADLISVSGHKIHAIKGSGALYIRPGLTLPPLLLGGGQEQNYRSGTEALPAIAAFGAACAAAYPTRMADLRHQAALRDLLRQKIAQLPGWQLLGAAEAPQIISCALPGVPSQNIINLLQDHDCYVSAGSACSKGHRSHVLQACGLPPAVIDSSIRISLSRFTTEAEAAQLLAAMQAATAYFKAHEKRR